MIACASRLSPHQRAFAHSILLFIDATTLHWFPPLRFAWAFRSDQAVVKITGRNAKGVLFGAINFS